MSFPAQTINKIPLKTSHIMSLHGGLHRDGISAFYGVYVISVVSVMFLYPSRNYGGRTEIFLYTQE